MLRVNTKPRKRNSPRIAEKSAPAFLQWLRGRNCLLLGFGHTECIGQRTEAAHVDHGGDKGMGTKVADRWAIPLCSYHHSEQHRLGWITFQQRYRLDALSTAAAFWNKWPGRIAWERKLAGE